MPRPCRPGLTRSLLTLAGAVAAAAPAAASAGALGPAPPPCFGAAARDPARPCENPALRFRARPSPADAPLEPNSPCTPTFSSGARSFCVSGAPKARARQSVALLGDSHAPSWRAAVEGAADAERWRLLTLSRSGCPFGLARRLVSPGAENACLAWVDGVVRRLRAHPEITTVIVANSARHRFAPTGGLDPHASAVAGYRAAFATLPASVHRIVVLRDNPRAEITTLDCVQRAVSRHERADRRCGLPRATALTRDPAAEAAEAEAPRGRARVIDLSRFFCDEQTCFPVVGGALVFKDDNHLTATFSATLAPYFRAAYRRLER